MTTWTDTKNRQWSVFITVGLLKRARELNQVDLLTILDGELWTQLDDPTCLIQTMWILTESQASNKNIDRDSFERAIEGDVIDQATQSLLPAIIRFFPDLGTKRKNEEKPKDDHADSRESKSERAWKVIHEVAGIAAVDPSSFSWRELVWMATGRRRLEWSQTTRLLAQFANAHRDKKKHKREFDPNDFMPDDLKEAIRRTTGIRLTADNLHILKPYFSQN